MSLRSSSYVCLPSLLAVLSLGCPGPEPTLEEDGTGGAASTATGPGPGPGPGPASGSVVASTAVGTSSVASSGPGTGTSSAGGDGGADGGSGPGGGDLSAGGAGHGGDGGGCGGADLDTNPLHCGACGFECSDFNAEDVKCSGGRCVPKCALGWGDLTGENDGELDDGCETEVTRVFVTDESFPGDFGTLGNDGVTVADTQCQFFADEAQLGGTWQAWLSSAPEASRPGERFALRSQVPYVVIGRGPDIVVAQSFDDMLDNGLIRPIDVTENGDPFPGRVVWTGTNANGNPTSNTCMSWQTESIKAEGTVGTTSDTDDAWTNSDQQTCIGDDAVFAHLYCFEQ